MQAVNVNDIKKHIHAELFEKNVFQSSRENLKCIEDIKGHWKEETLLRCIRIMRNHNQTDGEIRKMLGDRFFLDCEEINRLLKKEE